MSTSLTHTSPTRKLKDKAAYLIVGLAFVVAVIPLISILWTVAVFIVLIGAIYYLAVGRRKTFPPVTAPSGDDPIEEPAGAA